MNELLLYAALLAALGGLDAIATAAASQLRHWIEERVNAGGIGRFFHPLRIDMIRRRSD